MRRAYDYWQNQPGCYLFNKLLLESARKLMNNTLSKHGIQSLPRQLILDNQCCSKLCFPQFCACVLRCQSTQQRVQRRGGQTSKAHRIRLQHLMHAEIMQRRVWTRKYKIFSCLRNKQSLRTSKYRNARKTNALQRQKVVFCHLRHTWLHRTTGSENKSYATRNNKPTSHRWTRRRD